MQKTLAFINANNYHLHHWLVTSEQSATKFGYGISSSGLTRYSTRPLWRVFFCLQSSASSTHKKPGYGEPHPGFVILLAGQDRLAQGISARRIDAGLQV